MAVPHFEETSDGLPPAVRPFLTGGIGSVAEVACRSAFWKFSRTTVAQFLSQLKIPFDTGSALFDLLLVGCERVLKLSPEESLKIVHRRVAANEAENIDASTTLLFVDEALEVLEQQEAKLIAQEKSCVLAAKEDAQAFKARYVTHAARVRASAMPAARKASKAVKKPLAFPFHLDQKDAKLFAPPDASIWRADVRVAWHGHQTGKSRISESFASHGSSESALKALLQHLWRSHLTEKGLTEADCPIVGIISSSASSSA